MASQDSSAFTRPALLLGLLFLALIAMFYRASGYDLQSLWLAAAFFENGPAAVYAVSGDTFQMKPPDAWMAAVLAGETTSAIYPYIYPPIWAWALAPLTDAIDFQAFLLGMSFLNAALVTAMVYLAWRIASPGLPALAFIGICAVIAMTSLVVLLPLSEAQPQIIVSFLILLGIERDKSNHPIIGGAAMALAAAIKLYPLIFALFWLCGGRRATFSSFVITGAALGLTSLAVAGWPMHAAFLHEISAISGTVLTSLAIFSLDPLLAVMLIGTENMASVTTQATGGATGWQVYAKPALWSVISLGVQLVTIAGLGWLAWKTRLKDPLFWPLAFIAIAWVSPLSWLYHYMTAIFFLPALLHRFGTVSGILLSFLIVMPTNLAVRTFFSALFDSPLAIVVTTNAALLLAAIAFFIAVIRSQRPFQT